MSGNGHLHLMVGLLRVVSENPDFQAKHGGGWRREGKAERAGRPVSYRCRAPLKKSLTQETDGRTDAKQQPQVAPIISPMPNYSRGSEGGRKEISRPRRGKA